MSQNFDQSKLNWRKSSFCNADACVEVAAIEDGGGVLVRDSKQQGEGPILHYTPKEWQAFLDGTKNGEFDVLVDQ